MPHVGVIYDGAFRPETTGGHALRALQCLTEAVHLRPDQLGSVDPAEFRLFLRVDDGLEYPVPDQLRPLAWWAIDTHLSFERCLRQAQRADFVFAAQKNGAERLRGAGSASAQWLPLACDPVTQGRRNTPNRYDVAFVGNIFPGEREQLLALLQEHYPRSFLGPADYRQLGEIYSAAKIVFNCSLRDDINMRVFEGLCSGSLVITNDLAENGQNDLFTPGEHLVTYRSPGELLEKTAYYLAHDAERQRIARAGWERVLGQHTYLHRMQQLLRTVEQSASSLTSAATGPEGKISACLLSWKRPRQLRQIVDQLLRESLIDDIVIWNNNPDLPLTFPEERVRVINSDRNLVTYGRYLATQHARHEVIYTQDDDCLVGNIPELIATFRADPTRMAHALKLGHLLANPQHVRDGAQIGLLGWGAVFQRGWTKVLEDYREKFGEDRYLVRDADRLFSVLQQRRHRSLLAEVVDLEGSTGPAAMSLEPEHQEVTRQAIEQAHRFLKEGTEVRGQGSERTNSPEASSSSPPLKSSTYYEFPRPDVLELVPLSARRVLDVGCGGGKLGASIQQRQGAHVTGIELHPSAIEAAVQRLDEVLIGDIQNAAIEFPAGQVDCVICADVLEHLRDPLPVLRKIRRWLAPEGTLVTSIPNVRHHTVLRSLLAGNWTYESAGLLDEDHVRFFTRREIEKLLFRAGFSIQQQRMVGDEAYRTWQQQGSPRQIQLGPFQLQAASPDEAAELFAYQYLTTATPAPERSFGLTSIVLVTYNQWPHTKACLESIRLLTDEPYELIVVDNGSTDGTVEFLRADPGIHLIENHQNRGFPAAANQGILAARGEQILLLNNDTLVTTGWLGRLLTALNSNAAIGLVGPVTNHISGEQQVSVPYDDLAQLDGFAWEWGKQHHRQYQPTDRLVGFCLLIRREVIQKIGLLDERFGIGNFEDDDYCRRAIAAGYQCVIARDAFIHHVGSATFRASGVNFGQLLEENQRKYTEKWGEERGQGTEVKGQGNEESRHPTSHFTPSSDQRFDSHSSAEEQPANVHDFRTFRDSVAHPPFLLELNEAGEFLLTPNDIRLSACLIVRDNEHTIRPCLESLLPWMDEVVVVDTGSLDRTPQICEELGARVLHSPWQDSFSQARNVSLDQARGEWIFWMDSDDTLPEICGRKLRELVDGDHPDAVLGYIVQVHCPGETPDDVTVVDHVKLLRNRPDLRFEFHIHEQILPAIRRAGGEVAWTDLYVIHSGSDKTPAGRQRKLARDFKLLELDLAERPDHPFVLFNLGMTCADAGQQEEAVQYLTRCVQVSSPQESHLRKAYALLVGALMQLRRWNDAADCLTRGLRPFPQDKELLFRQAMLFHQQGQLRSAEQTYLRILQEQTGRHFTSMDTGITNHKARHNLAIVYEDLCEFDLARQVWTDILHSHPGYQPALRALRQLEKRQRHGSPTQQDSNF